MRGIKCLRNLLLILWLGSCLSFAQSSGTTCTKPSGKPCPKWEHWLIGQYPPLPPPLPTREEVERMHNAHLFTLGDQQMIMHPSKKVWALDIAAWGAAWGCTVAAVRNPRSGEHTDEYAAMAGLTALSQATSLTIMPAFGPGVAGYPIYHYCKAALR